MPQSLPHVSTLLAAAVQYLEQELLPTLSGYHRFQTRVAINALSTIGRELELRSAQESQEHERLIALLGHQGNIEELSHELAERIRAGAIALDDPVLRQHIRQSLADALAINNPKWLDR